MVIINGASDATPQEPHDITWLHTRYDGGPIRREDIGDVFLSMDADGKRLTWQQAHQLAGVAHGIVQRHGNHRYARGYSHGIDTGAREGHPGEPRCEILVGPFTSCGQQLLDGDDMCGEHRARSYVDIIEQQQRDIELLRAELDGSLIEKARGLLGDAGMSRTEIPVVTHELLRVLEGNVLTVRTLDGEDVTLRLATPDLLARLRRAEAANRAAIAEAWDEGCAAGMEWTPSGPNGVPHDPPSNPYDAADLRAAVTDTTGDPA